MVEYIVDAISTLEWPANATAITVARRDDRACQARSYNVSRILSEDSEFSVCKINEISWLFFCRWASRPISMQITYKIFENSTACTETLLSMVRLIYLVIYISLGLLVLYRLP